jgi:hypothetical protein
MCTHDSTARRWSSVKKLDLVARGNGLTVQLFEFKRRRHVKNGAVAAARQGLAAQVVHVRTSGGAACSTNSASRRRLLPGALY